MGCRTKSAVPKLRKGRDGASPRGGPVKGYPTTTLPAPAASTAGASSRQSRRPRSCSSRTSTTRRCSRRASSIDSANRAQCGFASGFRPWTNQSVAVRGGTPAIRAALASGTPVATNAAISYSSSPVSVGRATTGKIYAPIPADIRRRYPNRSHRASQVSSAPTAPHFLVFFAV